MIILLYNSVRGIHATYSNDINRFREHKNNLKSILKECCNRNKTYCGLEDKINTLLYKYDIKREVFSAVS